MQSGTAINPVTQRPYEYPVQKSKVDPLEIQRLKNQIKIDAAFDSEAGEALKKVVHGVLTDRIEYFLLNDPAGQVCMQLLKNMHQHQNAAANAARKLIEKYGGIV